jgi:hypothetical protein
VGKNARTDDAKQIDLREFASNKQKRVYSCGGFPMFTVYASIYTILVLKVTVKTSFCRENTGFLKTHAKTAK